MLQGGVRESCCHLQARDPKSGAPGNPDFMKEDAQRAVDNATVLMDRLGMGHPGKINVDDDASVAEWYECLRPLRRNEY